MRLHNFVLDQIKKHLALYNFSEIKIQDINNSEREFATTNAATHEYPKILKVYAYSQELDQINIKISNTDNIEQYAYFIKMLDAFFMEKLKLENYALKINFGKPQTNVPLDYNQGCIELTNLLQILSVSYVVDPNLKTMFEFVSRDIGEKDVFTYGKRCVTYNYNKNNMQNISASIDLNKLITLVEKYQNRLLIPENPTLHIVIPASNEQKSLALLIADRLQSNSLSTDVFLENLPIPEMIKRSNKLGAKYVLIIGEEEQKHGTVTIKNMQNSEIFSVKQSEIISYLK